MKLQASNLENMIILNIFRSLFFRGPAVGPFITQTQACPSKSQIDHGCFNIDF